MAGDPKVDAFVARAKQWRDVIEKLRVVLHGCDLDESLKWGKPCYAADGKNIAIIQPFKAHCALMFFKGVLLEDPRGLLRSQGENSQSAMRLEFTRAADVKKTVVGDFVKRAIAIEREGKQVAKRPASELELPAELEQVMKRDRVFRDAFRKLTPGRQRGYALHFAGAKQAKTRLARIEKCAPRILAGLGMHDR